MRDHHHEEWNSNFDMDSLLSLMRVIAAGLGVITIVIGLFYLTRIFGLVYDALHSPRDFATVFARWVDAVGGSELDINFSGDKFPAARLLATVVLGGGMLILTWITMGITFTGAKIVSWTAGDRDAIKRILRHAFGPAMEPAKQAGGNQT